MTIQFHECNELDIDLVVKLGKETYLETFSEMNSQGNMDKYLAAAFNREKIAEEIANSNSKFFLLYYSHKLAGYLKVNENEAQTEFRDKSGLEIERIYIRKKYHGMGFGKALINKGIVLAHQMNKKVVWLGVWEKNIEAIHFYEKMGFRKFATHGFLMGDEQQTDYLMKKEV